MRNCFPAPLVPSRGGPAHLSFAGLRAAESGLCPSATSSHSCKLCTWTCFCVVFRGGEIRRRSAGCLWIGASAPESQRGVIPSANSLNYLKSSFLATPLSFLFFFEASRCKCILCHSWLAICFIHGHCWGKGQRLGRMIIYAMWDYTLSRTKESFCFFYPCFCYPCTVRISACFTRELFQVSLVKFQSQ